MADVLKYGWAYGGKQGQEMRCARAQYFNRLGGAFVTASGATGVMTLTTASTDVIVGWAEVPRAAVPGIVDYWISDDTTVGKDRIHVITDPSAVYCMPADESVGSVTASLIGRYICASLTGATTTAIQYAMARATTAAANQQLFVVGVDTVQRSFYVRVNPHHVA
jgi:hypothetical protein